ncbi:SWIM zinc finger family protein [Nonomuraea pusilla]|uniref:SWIM zinc finger family protein n=1 Tax=Nonomuraea pusilla TaxID=46177 RepID=UPI00344253A6
MGDLEPECSCPDWGHPCKHAAACRCGAGRARAGRGAAPCRAARPGGRGRSRATGPAPGRAGRRPTRGATAGRPAPCCRWSAAGSAGAA